MTRILNLILIYLWFQTELYLSTGTPTRAPNEWALAAQHNQRILQYAKCSKPFPRVINVHGELRSSATKKYIPHCTILHFCGEHSGCCRQETEQCVPAKTEQVKLYFLTIELTAKGHRKGIEVITMTNHTECHCAPINAQRRIRSQLQQGSDNSSSTNMTFNNTHANRTGNGQQTGVVLTSTLSSTTLTSTMTMTSSETITTTTESPTTLQTTTIPTTSTTSETSNQKSDQSSSRSQSFFGRIFSSSSSSSSSSSLLPSSPSSFSSSSSYLRNSEHYNSHSI